MFSACTSAVVSTPRVKSLKATFSMPSVEGLRASMPSVGLLSVLVENPCVASDGPTPPWGWPTALALRMKLKWNSLRVELPKVTVWPRLASCARPWLVAEKPGTLAPPVPVG